MRVVRRKRERANLNFARFRMKRQIHLAAPPMVAAIGAEPHACAHRAHTNSELFSHRSHPRARLAQISQISSDTADVLELSQKTIPIRKRRGTEPRRVRGDTVPSLERLLERRLPFAASLPGRGHDVADGKVSAVLFRVHHVSESKYFLRLADTAKLVQAQARERLGRRRRKAGRRDRVPAQLRGELL